uniref:Uncharacterized protein n=1 Tax=Anguilla anguilla TaxID=7936 RepID=A0A0E9X5V3_ANGAN
MPFHVGILKESALQRRTPELAQGGYPLPRSTPSKLCGEISGSLPACACPYCQWHSEFECSLYCVWQNLELNVSAL